MKFFENLNKKMYDEDKDEDDEKKKEGKCLCKEQLNFMLLVYVYERQWNRYRLGQLHTSRGNFL